jgi:hypothetical protein
VVSSRRIASTTSPMTTQQPLHTGQADAVTLDQFPARRAGYELADEFCFIHLAQPTPYSHRSNAPHARAISRNLGTLRPAMFVGLDPKALPTASASGW